MTKSIYLILLLGMSWISSAEMAYYKEIPLDDIRTLRATGHINIELKAGNDNKLELFLKPGVKNELKIGIETKLLGKSELVEKNLHIREIFNKGEGKKAGHIADIVITSNELSVVLLHGGVNSFKADGYSNSKSSLYLRTGNTKKVSLSNLNLSKLTVGAYGNSTVTLENSQIGLLNLNQSRTSKMTLSDVHVLDGSFTLFSKSELKLADVEMKRLHLEGSNRSKVVADSNSEIGYASFKLSKMSQADFSNAQVEQSTHQTEHSAQLYLKDREPLQSDMPAEPKSPMSVKSKEGLNE